jgi:hypothetical protein
MSKTIELPTGKIIELNRFVALIPDKKDKDNRYLLFLEGYSQPIDVDSTEVSILKQYLPLQSSQNTNGSWDREEQIRLNQPKMEKLKEKINRMKQEQPSAEKAEFFESFKRTMDAHRSGRKLYEHSSDSIY